MTGPGGLKGPPALLQHVLGSIVMHVVRGEHRDPAMAMFGVVPREERSAEGDRGGDVVEADDCDALRGDPLFKLAVGRAPESGRDLCSQPTMSRLENAPSRIEVARMTAALVDIFCRSFPAPPTAITLDIDDTCDPVHGRQQMSLFNAHYDTRCFLPVHVYHVESGKPVAVLLVVSRFSSLDQQGF